MKNPRTWVEIDLGKVQANLKKIKSHLKADTQILAVVKANAYGHGAIAIARTVHAKKNNGNNPAITVKVDVGMDSLFSFIMTAKGLASRGF